MLAVSLTCNCVVPRCITDGWRGRRCRRGRRPLRQTVHVSAVSRDTSTRMLFAGFGSILIFQLRSICGIYILHCDYIISAYRNVVVAGVRYAGRGRKTWRECVRMIWMSWVYTLNGWCSGISGEASYREKRQILAERGRNRRFKKKW